MVGVRMQPSLLELVDNWIAGQPDHPSRPEAARRLIEKCLAAPAGPEQIDADAATKAAQDAGIAPEKLNAENDGQVL